MGVMGETHGRGQGMVALGLVLAGILLAVCPFAFALNPALDVSQYAHTAWKIRDGFLKTPVRGIAQTTDGYLWLGTETGLFRFDGVRFVHWQPPPNQNLPANSIWSLLAARNGVLWIGSSEGLASWKDGKLTEYPELAGQYIFKLLEDREGTVWVGGAGVPTGSLCAIRKGSVQSYGKDGALGRGVLSLYEDSKGRIWAGVEGGLWRWKPGPPKFYPLPGEPNGIWVMGEDDEGAPLVGRQGAIHRFLDGKSEPYPLSVAVGKLRAARMLRDRDGGLWIGTSDRGLVHVHQGRTDVFATSDGLSGEDVYALFEDREGNIWVATINGLHRFRDFAVATLNERQGLSNDTVGSVLADRDGSVWISTYGGLDRWENGHLVVPRTGGRKPDGKLNGHSPASLFQDRGGRIWVSTSRGIGYLQNDRFISVSGVPGGNVLSIVEDTAENLWIADEPNGLIHLLRGRQVERMPWSALGHKDHASVLAADQVQGGLWLGFFLGGIAYWRDGQVRASYTTSDGLGEGHINYLRLDQDGTLWAATEGGLSRLKNGRIATLSSKNGLPCDTVHWMMGDDAHSFWLYTACGLLRIDRAEIDNWIAAVDQNQEAKRMIRATVFDSSDGVRIVAMAGHYSPQVARSADGTLWFPTLGGVNVIDPAHLPFNRVPPPVHIEQVIADRKTYDVTSDGNAQLRVPPLVRDLQIDYTALSLTAPEKVFFRYKLEGRDRDWQDAGNRRQAFYNDLPPGNYRFRVRACNNSGVWNEAGTFLNFAVVPAYYQTAWFRLSSLAAFLALLVGLYRLRLRQLARQFNLRLEGRVTERTRIARELHDTLLQSFQGVLMKFSAVTYLLPDRPAEAQKTLESVVEQARQAITEARDAVQGLRSSTVISNDLARTISTLAEELAPDQTGSDCPEFRVQVEGKSRDLAPLIRDEVYRIAGEALRNAFRHAQARRVEVEICYDRRQLRLRVRDDGKGMAPEVLGEGKRPGHHGLPGMRERAQLVGGKLAVWSELNRGTEVELTIPASLAYAQLPVARRWMFSGKGS
jgi:signal transduction histidine kinase/ligand-binding sensor domain-containing protein